MAKAKPKHKPYGMTSPCPKCPFRSDVKGYLTKARVSELKRGLRHGEFFCHETTGDCDDEQSYIPNGKEVHCAGALILLEKLGQPSQMMRIAERIGLYSAQKLNMRALVFNSFAEMRKAQKR